MKRLALVLMSNICYLTVVLIFLVVTAYYLMVSTGYMNGVAGLRTAILLINFIINFISHRTPLVAASGYCKASGHKRCRM